MDLKSQRGGKWDHRRLTEKIHCGSGAKKVRARGLDDRGLAAVALIRPGGGGIHRLDGATARSAARRRRPRGPSYRAARHEGGLERSNVNTAIARLLRP